MDIINNYILSDNRKTHLDELINTIDKTYGIENINSIIIQLPFKHYDIYKEKVKWCDFNGTELKYKFGSIPQYNKINIITNNEFNEPRIFVILKSLDEPLLIRF